MDKALRRPALVVVFEDAAKARIGRKRHEDYRESDKVPFQNDRPGVVDVSSTHPVSLDRGRVVQGGALCGACAATTPGIPVGTAVTLEDEPQCRTCGPK